MKRLHVAAFALFGTLFAVKASAFTPAALPISLVTTGGTSVIAVTGPNNGGYIYNPPNAASQGIAGAENLYVDLVGTPGSTDAAANGTTTIVVPGATFTIPPLSAGTRVRVNAATSLHAFSGSQW